MVDVCYKQGREGTLLDVTVHDIYLCTSVEFLCTVADIFIKANEQSSAALRSSKQASVTSKEAGRVIHSTLISTCNPSVNCKN